MGRKKKKKGNNKHAFDFEEAEEEMLALHGIYDQDFHEHEFGRGFTILIVPHPGDTLLNQCSVEMEIRLGICAKLLISPHTHRFISRKLYSTDFPHVLHLLLGKFLYCWEAVVYSCIFFSSGITKTCCKLQILAGLPIYSTQPTPYE